MSARWMRIVIAAAAAGAMGCGSDCPTETPTVDAVQSCTVSAGARVPVGVRLCPTCNQSLAGCSGELISSSEILLDPLVEQCQNGACDNPPACNLNSACTITAPSQPNDYRISVVGTANELIAGTLTVVDASVEPSCTFASALVR